MRSKIFEASQTYWEQEMAVKILSFARDELYMELRFMGIALSVLEPKPDGRLTTLATDGEKMFYSAEQLLRLFRDNPAYIDRLYLHSVLHCIFSHLWLGGSRNRYRWGIACDIAVEYTIDHLDKKCTRRILSFLRKETYARLEEEKRISAAQIYEFLGGKSPEQLQELYQEFFSDDHGFWPRERKEQAGMMESNIQKKWRKIARQTQLEQKKKGDEKQRGEEYLSYQLKGQKSRRSYREFLKKFAVLREEMHCDPDSYDLTYYTYGLRMYGNMPLIEPMESREVHKIQDFVVVVDTSYSTSGKLVENFLRETFEILQQEENFFRHCRMHVIQCDEKVQRDDVVENEQMLERLFWNFQIQGGGGTDFRPAFAYVNDLLEQGDFSHLCGLLYFTDGKGIYPGKKPSYKTAFLFLEDYEEEQVPVWAMRLRLEREELEKSIRKK